MEKSLDLSSDDLPSYSETYTVPTSLAENLTSVRTARIHSLLETYIKPHLLKTTLAGLSHSTLVLIPSAVPSLTPNLDNDSKDHLGQQASFPGEEIVGFSDAGNLTKIRLRGQENSFEFWGQLRVVEELKRALQAHLTRDNDVRDVEVVVLPARLESRGWFKKKASPSSIPQQKTEKVKASGGSKVKTEVELEDVSLRTTNAMGLYETKTGKAIIVKVDFDV